MHDKNRIHKVTTQISREHTGTKISTTGMRTYTTKQLKYNQQPKSKKTIYMPLIHSHYRTMCNDKNVQSQFYEAFFWWEVTKKKTSFLSLKQGIGQASHSANVEKSTQKLDTYLLKLQNRSYFGISEQNSDVFFVYHSSQRHDELPLHHVQVVEIISLCFDNFIHAERSFILKQFDKIL